MKHPIRWMGAEIHRCWRERWKLLRGAGIAMVIGFLAAYLVPKVLGEEFLVRQVARIYAPLVGALYGHRHRDEVSVMLIDDAALQSAGQSWPAEYAYYGRLLDAMTTYRPRAVFIDVIFAAARKDPGLDRLIAAACRARQAGVSVYFATRRDPAGRFLLRPELEAVSPRCLQKVAVEYDPDAADQTAWTYPVAADSSAQGDAVRSVAGTIYRDLGGRMPAHQHSELAVDWGLAPAARGIDWLALPSAEHAGGHEASAGIPENPAAGHAPEPALDSYCRSPVPLWRELLVPPFFRSAVWGDEGVGKPICVFHNTLYPADLQAASDADEQALARHVEGRVVMVGTALQGSNDRVLSPLHGRIPGVYMHAMALDNLLTYGSDYRRAAHLAWGRDGVPVAALVMFALLLIMVGRAFSKRLHASDFDAGGVSDAAPRLRRRAKEAARWLVWKVSGLAIYSVFFGLMLLVGQWLHLGFLTVIHVSLFAFAAEWLEWSDSMLEWWRAEPGEGETTHPGDGPAARPAPAPHSRATGHRPDPSETR